MLGLLVWCDENGPLLTPEEIEAAHQAEREVRAKIVREHAKKRGKRTWTEEEKVWITTELRRVFK